MSRPYTVIVPRWIQVQAVSPEDAIEVARQAVADPLGCEAEARWDFSEADVLAGLEWPAPERDEEEPDDNADLD